MSEFESQRFAWQLALGIFSVLFYVGIVLVAFDWVWLTPWIVAGAIALGLVVCAIGLFVTAFRQTWVRRG